MNETISINTLGSVDMYCFIKAFIKRNNCSSPSLKFDNTSDTVTVDSLNDSI